MIGFKSKFNWGDTLYIKDDPNQSPRTLVGIYLTPGAALYTLTIAGEPVDVFEFEVSAEADQSILLNINPREDE